MSDIDDAAEARRLMPGRGEGIMPNHTALAQVHATLALVAATEKVAEQARIANLIAYHAAGMHKGAIDGPGLPGPHEQARKGLRL